MPLSWIADYVKAAIAGMWEWALELCYVLWWGLSELVYWLFDPTVVLSAAVAVFGGMLDFIKLWAPSSVDAVIDQIGTVFSDETIGRIYNIGLFFTSAALTPTLVHACIGLVLNLWCAMALVRIIVWAKGHFWSSSQ